MKKTASIILSGHILLALTACSTGDRSPEKYSPYRQEAIGRGRTDAGIAISARNQMEREKAILEIRAKEQRLRQAGDDAAADFYISAAEELLDSAGIIRITHPSKL